MRMTLYPKLKYSYASLGQVREMAEIAVDQNPAISMQLPDLGAHYSGDFRLALTREDRISLQSAYLTRILESGDRQTSIVAARTQDTGKMVGYIMFSQNREDQTVDIEEFPISAGMEEAVMPQMMKMLSMYTDGAYITIPSSAARFQRLGLTPNDLGDASSVLHGDWRKCMRGAATPAIDPVVPMAFAN